MVTVLVCDRLNWGFSICACKAVTGANKTHSFWFCVWEPLLFFFFCLLSWVMLLLSLELFLYFDTQKVHTDYSSGSQKSYVLPQPTTEALAEVWNNAEQNVAPTNSNVDRSWWHAKKLSKSDGNRSSRKGCILYLWNSFSCPEIAAQVENK